MQLTGERILSIDFIRGIAVLGIFMINVESFCYPHPFNPVEFGFENSLDRDVRFWVYTLFQGKFFGVFALLFAIGFDIFLSRLEIKGFGLSAMDIYGRRLLWLFLFGLFHSIFLWTGDILHHYAICGLLLIPFRSLSQKWLLRIVILLVVVLLYNDFKKVETRIVKYDKYEKAILVAEEDRSEAQRADISTWLKITSSKSIEQLDFPRLGGYWDNFHENLKSTRFNFGQFFYSGIAIRTLLLMFMGIWLFRLGVFVDCHQVKYYWRYTLLVLGVGLWMNYNRSYHWTYFFNEPILSFSSGLFETLAKEMLAVGYVLALNGIYQKWSKSFSNGLLSSVGKMALSVYIIQTLVGVFIFYGYGLGFFNAFSRSQLLIVVLLSWLFQLIIVWWYSRSFSNGPLEIFWRKMTYYGSKQRLQ